MAERILVPYDGSSPANEALDLACELFPDASIVALTVVDPSEASYVNDGAPFPEEWQEDAFQSAEETLDEACEHVLDRELETHYKIGRPSHAIVDFVEDEDIDHVVMGSNGRTGVARLLLGSVAETVVRRSPVPVTVVR
jgi:nucleotide-binding universal stress UspA family protein